MSEYTATNDYRGTNHNPLCLGNYVTIQDGTYNIQWKIAGFDTELYKGDIRYAGYGITLIPITFITTSYMNSTNTTSGGYHGSYMHQTILPAIATALQTVLGSRLVQRRVLVSNNINSSAISPGYSGWTGIANNFAWADAYCTLMTEIQVYGSRVWGGGFDTGEASQKLPIFNFVKPNLYSRGNHFWLRDIASSTQFARSTGQGVADSALASDTLSVRPLIYIS